MRGDLGSHPNCGVASQWMWGLGSEMGRPTGMWGSERDLGAVWGGLKGGIWGPRGDFWDHFPTDRRIWGPCYGTGGSQRGLKVGGRDLGQLGSLGGGFGGGGGVWGVSKGRFEVPMGALGVNSQRIEGFGICAMGQGVPDGTWGP